MTKIDMKKKQVVLLVTHFINDMIKRQYYRLRDQLNKVEYDVFLLINVEHKGSINIPIDITYHICEYDSLNKLEYEPIGETLLPGSCHFPLLKFYKENPDYSYYWFIEYDVFFTGNWETLMNSFKNMDYDFIGSHVAKYDNAKNGKWHWWNDANNVGYDLNECVKGFDPIFRCSNSALEYIDRYQRAGFSAHEEVILTTCLYNAGFKIGDFGGTGEFVPDGFKNRFYISGSEIHDGTMRYRPVFQNSDLEKMIPDKLYHPLKG